MLYLRTTRFPLVVRKASLFYCRRCSSLSSILDLLSFMQIRIEDFEKSGTLT